MLDLTPHIKIAQKSITSHTVIRCVVYTSFIFICICAAKNIIFPTQIFNFDASIDSLANTISRPYELEYGTGFHISTVGESNQLHVSITLPEDAPELPKDTNILIKKSYNAFLSPISTQKYTDHLTKTFNTEDRTYLEKDATLFPLISQNAQNSYLFNENLSGLTTEQLGDFAQSDDVVGFAPGTLISSREGIFVTDGPTRHPVQDERTFVGLGYNFDNVIETDNKERSVHKKARMLTIASEHPFGTIFYTRDTNHSFIYDQKTLHRITTTPQTKQYGISATEKSRTALASCTLEKSAFAKRYFCTASIENIAQFPGNTYQITLDDAPGTKIQKMRAKLFTTVNKKSLQDRITTLKTELVTQL